jgi:hypothetical protein
MEPTIEIKSIRNLAQPEQDEVYKLLAVVFEADISHWTWSQDDYRLLVRVDNHIVSHVSIIERTCLVNEAPAWAVWAHTLNGEARDWHRWQCGKRLIS